MKIKHGDLIIIVYMYKFEFISFMMIQKKQEALQL